MADQADLGVEALEAAVAEAEPDGGEDAVAVRCSVRAWRTNGRSRERVAQAGQASRCSGARGWVVEVVEQPELLAQQERAVEATVGALYLGERGEVADGLAGGRFEQRPAGALDPAAGLGVRAVMGVSFVAADRHQTDDQDRRPPIDAAWSGSPVPAPVPHRGSATARRCSPTTSWPSSNRPAGLLGPFAMWPALPAPDYYGQSPPRHHQPTRACPPQMGGTGTVPTFTTSRSTGSAPSSSPCSIATSTPQTFLAASPPTALPRLRSPRPRSRTACAAIRPTSTRFEPASRLRGFNHWFTSVTPFRLAERAQGRPVVPARLAVVGAAPALTRAPGIGLPPAFARLLRQPDAGALSSPFDWWRLVAHNAVATRTSSSRVSR